MVPMLRLSLRQLAGRWRLLLILLLAALPVAVAATVSVVAEAEEMQGGVIDAIFDGLIIAAILPLVAMTLGTAAFGNELEDRTLGYLTLKPVPRLQIALSKLLAPIIVGGPLLIASGVISTLLGFQGDIQAALAVGVSLLVGLVAYTAIFTWAGLMTSGALAFALLYVLVWEGVISTFLGGVRYLSVRGYTLAIMHGIDGDSFKEFSERVIELPAAIAGAVAVTVFFFWLTVYRLRTMDVP
jgi:ABC-2 type transport system permease protein